MQILDGKKIRDKRASVLASRVCRLKKKPVLAIVQVGNNSASNIYIEQKRKFGERIGASVEVFKIEDKEQSVENMEDYLRKLIGNLNEDDDVTGIIVQLPLPESLDPKTVSGFIDAEKDVDGLTENSKFITATTRGIKTLLDEYGISVENKKVTVIGRSDLVGRPTAKYMESLGAEVSICDEFTENNPEVARGADILISAVGKKGLVTKDHVKEGQVVVDVGINKSEDGICGDVAFDEVSKIVEYITPVPGGVGPMTVLSLFENLVDSVDSK